MFWIVRFILFWLVWIAFADKSRWREMVPVCIFAALLGSLTDTAIHHYPLWYYDETIIPEWTDDLSVYPVVVYLFIQWLPENQTWRSMTAYIFVWTAVSIAIEWFHLQTGHMSYPNGIWTIEFSYISDWFLFWLFYKFHKELDLKRLNP